MERVVRAMLARLVVADLVGAEDREPVFPDRAVDLVGGEPGLRGHFEDEGGEIRAGDGARDFPAISGIRGLHVTIEGGQRRGVHGGMSQGEAAGENQASRGKGASRHGVGNQVDVKTLYMSQVGSLGKVEAAVDLP